MRTEPRFLATAIGSLPHKSTDKGCRLMFDCLPEMPAWPQLPRLSFLENMYVQYSEGLPGIQVDRERERVWFKTDGDFSEQLEEFYRAVIDEDLERFAVSAEYASGLAAVLGGGFFEDIRGKPYLKGQITGPVSYGLTVTDQDGRASMYNEVLEEAVVKALTLKARWQVEALRLVAPDAEIVLFVDEPYLVSVGSALISVDREKVISDMRECVSGCGADITGMHCCGNTDWSIVFETGVDIVNFDAFDFMEGFTAYDVAISEHLEGGGAIAWGIVPNGLEAIESEVTVLADALEKAFDSLEQRGVDREALAAGSIITPACGLGPTTVEAAESALALTVELSRVLAGRYFG